MEPNKFIEKQSPHYRWDDWYTQGNQFESESDKLSSQAIKQCRISSEMRTHSCNPKESIRDITNMFISERIAKVEEWFNKLKDSLLNLEHQMKRLEETKNLASKSIERDKLFLETAKEILTLRDRKFGVDLVEDDVYHKAKEEVDLLSNVIKRLLYDVDENIVILSELKERRSTLISDLSDKERTLKIDRYLLRLTPFSLDAISLKPWPEEQVESSIDVSTWLSHCTEIKRDADEIADRTCQKIVVSRNVVRDKDSDVGKIREVTRHALVLRLQEDLEARDALVNQRKVLVERIANLDDEIRAMEVALNDALINLKLNHTRLENRKFRPGKELCKNHDIRNSLIEENDSIKLTQHECSKTLGDLKILANKARKHLQDVEHEMLIKERSLGIDMACWNFHNRPPKASYQIEIDWLNPSVVSSYVRGFIERHINTREFSPMYHVDGANDDYLNRRLLELSLTTPSINRQEETIRSPDKIVCKHW